MRRLLGIHIIRWAEHVFGPVALDPQERVMRLFEEAAELAQAHNIEFERADVLIRRVWQNPRGDELQEYQQVCVAFFALAEVIGRDPEYAADEEFRRATKLDPEYLRQRHDRKVSIGIAKPRVP